MTLISTIYYDFRILRHFVAYYERHGVRRFLFAVWPDLISDAKLYVKSDRASRRIDWVPVERGQFNGEVDCLVHNEIRLTFIENGEWYIIADLDEFHHCPGFSDFRDAAATASSTGTECISGQIVDRIAMGGEIPKELKDHLSLGSQFPLIADLTTQVSQGCTAKILMARSNIEITPGHHFACAETSDIRGEVHHVKWWGSLIREQKRRAIDYEKQSLIYRQEPQRVVDFILANGGRIPIGSGAFNLRMPINDPLRYPY